MKNLPIVQRLRGRSPLPGGPAARRPFRLWMTGSVAVVMAAVAPGRSVAEETQRLQRHSRYGVHETAQRIEDAARSQGLSVLARTGGARPVIVLASSIGGTLVVMDEASARIDIPLSVYLQESSAGGVDVSIATLPDPGTPAWQELPSGVADDLAALPGLLQRALA